MDELWVFLVVVLALALGYTIYQNYYATTTIDGQNKKEGFWPGWRRGGWWPGWRGGWRGRWPGYYGYNYPYGYYPYYYY
jgi:hypothetical protein